MKLCPSKTLVAFVIILASLTATLVQFQRKRNARDVEHRKQRSRNNKPPKCNRPIRFCYPESTGNTTARHLKIGEIAPDFSLPLARDSRWRIATEKAIVNPVQYRVLDCARKRRQISLDELVQGNRKGVTIVVFWAFWCDTWKDVSGYFLRMKPKLQSEHAQIVCVAVDASQQPVARRAFGNGTLWYPVAIDANSATTANWGVRRVPTLFVLDKERRVRHVFEGFSGERALLKAIHEARKPLKNVTTDNTAQH